jgi:catechol 2,3-dioxygenase-like lactoylglutathione lyase family enzyme
MTFQYEALDHVHLAIPVGGEERARKFYCGILGFEEIKKPALLRKNGGAWFRQGSVNIHVGIEEPFIAAKRAHPAICVKHIDALKDYLHDKHVDFVVDERLPGANRFYIRDPFGNRIEFLEWE